MSHIRYSLRASRLADYLPLPPGFRRRPLAVMLPSVVSLLRPAGSTACRHAAPLSTSAPRCEIRKLARLRVVDNSPIGKEAMAEGRPPRVIHVYNKRSVATVGEWAADRGWCQLP